MARREHEGKGKSQRTSTRRGRGTTTALFARIRDALNVDVSELPWTTIAGAVTLFLTTLGGLAVSGLLERAQQNHGTALTVALGLVATAVAVWVLVKVPIVQAVAVAVFIVGLIVGMWAVIQTQNDTEVPVIAADFDPEKMSLEFTVESFDISSDEYIRVRVDGLFKLQRTRTLYAGTLGPNADGDVRQTVTLTVPKDEFDQIGIKAGLSRQSDECIYAEIVRETVERTPACVVYALPPSANQSPSRQ